MPSLATQRLATALRCGLPWWLSGKESACSAGDPGLIPGWERSPGEGNSNPLQYSCLENPTHRGAWWDIVHRVAMSQTRHSDYTTTTTHPLDVKTAFIVHLASVEVRKHPEEQETVPGSGQPREGNVQED